MAKKILFVDDEVDLVRTVVSRLEANGYDVITAYDGKEALDRVYKEWPDLIILDIMLPKMDGYKVCGLIKGNTKYKDIPIIMFTAKAKDEDRKLGMEVKANAYITKPFDPALLLSTIKKFLGEKRND